MRLAGLITASWAVEVLMSSIKLPSEITGGAPGVETFCTSSEHNMGLPEIRW